MNVRLLLGFLLFISVTCSSEPVKDDLVLTKVELKTFLKNDLEEKRECRFADYINKLDLSKATEYAKSEYVSDDIYFYGVLDGFGPSRPNFEFQFTKCVILYSKWEYIEAGGDTLNNCRSRTELRTKAYEYASLFNAEMTKLVKKDAKSYACPNAMQPS